MKGKFLQKNYLKDFGQKKLYGTFLSSNSRFSIA